MWAMRDAAEPQKCWGKEVVDEQGVRVDFRVALVWLKVAGREMWHECCDGEPAGEVHVVINVNSNACPWYGAEQFPKTIFSKARRSYWKRRFEGVIESEGEEWCEKDKQLAQEVRALMEGFESVGPGERKGGIRSWNEDGIEQA